MKLQTVFHYLHLYLTLPLDPIRANLKNLIAQVLFYSGFINLSLNYSCELLNFGLKIIIQRTTRTRNVLSAASKA